MLLLVHHLITGLKPKGKMSTLSKKGAVNQFKIYAIRTCTN